MADSDSLFYLKGQFHLGAYRTVASNPVPPKDHSEYLPTLLYTARSLVALGEPGRALSLVPADTEPSVRAVRAFATYVQTKAGSGDVEGILDELRDLTIEAEANDEEGAGESADEEGAGAGVVKVVAATAFFQEGEIEEALTTLGAGTTVKDIECLYLIVQIYLSMSRLDLAKKEYAQFKTNNPNQVDALLLALTEAAIGLASGGAPLVSAYHIFDEQVSAPGSSTNARLIASKGVTELLRGHHQEAQASFNEALGIDPKESTSLIGNAVIAQLSGKQTEADEAFNSLKASIPSHPYVLDIEAKSALFDQLKTNYSASAAA